MVAAPRVLWLDEIAADQRGIVGGKVTRCTMDRSSLTCDQDGEDVLTPAVVRLRELIERTIGGGESFGYHDLERFLDSL